MGIQEYIASPKEMYEGSTPSCSLKWLAYSVEVAQEPLTLLAQVQFLMGLPNFNAFNESINVWLYHNGLMTLLVTQFYVGSSPISHPK